MYFSPQTLKPGYGPCALGPHCLNKMIFFTALEYETFVLCLVI